MAKFHFKIIIDEIEVYLEILQISICFLVKGHRFAKYTIFQKSDQIMISKPIKFSVSEGHPSLNFIVGLK